MWMRYSRCIGNMAIIANFPWGWIGTIADNEIEIVSTISDPPKVRLAVEEALVESNLGSVSFNTRRPDGTHDEHGYIMGRLTADKQAGACYIALRPVGQEACREVLYMDPTQAIFRVPISAPNLSAPAMFRSDDGRYVYNVQGDPTPEYPHGRIVQYDTVTLPWTAVAILKPTAL